MSKESHFIGYDATEYSTTKHHPWRLWIEQWSIFRTFQQLGIALNGLQVGDFGSGTGFYSRMMIDLGASCVLAIDGDANMIEEAKKDSSLYNKLITYKQAWIEDTKGSNSCQLILGSYLLSYPKSPDEAALYCQAIASHLTEEGIFIGLGNNPFERTGGSQYHPYGFTKVHCADSEGDSDGAWVDYYLHGLTDPVRNYNLMPDTYCRAFKAAKMTLYWHKVSLHPSQENNPVWNTFFERESPINMMIATKGGCKVDLSAFIRSP